MRRSAKDIKKIIVHCSASDDDAAGFIDVIRKWHLLRGWNDVGYHFFIRRDGTIEKGRDISIPGAHCKGQNHDSIGICLHGKDREKFHHDQFVSLGALVQVLQLEYGDLTIHPHYEFDKNKTCPNFDSMLFDKRMCIEKE